MYWVLYSLFNLKENTSYSLLGFTNIQVTEGSLGYCGGENHLQTLDQQKQRGEGGGGVTSHSWLNISLTSCTVLCSHHG